MECFSKTIKMDLLTASNFSLLVSDGSENIQN